MDRDDINAHLAELNQKLFEANRASVSLTERHQRIFDRDRETIRRYSEELVPKMKATIEERNREIEVLTTERDNALLRIEELENERIQRIWGDDE
jgi:seryl-tRNA synthetase